MTMHGVILTMFQTYIKNNDKLTELKMKRLDTDKFLLKNRSINYIMILKFMKV